MKTGKQLQAALRASGFSQSAINAAWPDWWRDDADASPSAQNELRFSLARKLGLDPTALIEDQEPQFVWSDRTKYKRLSAENDFERSALSSFGTGIAKALLAATPPQPARLGIAAMEFRNAILKSQQYVRLPDLLGACWGLGIPVAYLRVFPLEAKRMSAMTVHVDGRYAILIGKDAKYPSPIAYYIAHEMGHIFLNHLEGQQSLIDIGDPLAQDEGDEEELAADRYALELLTGKPDPIVVTKTRHFLARQLADVSVQSAPALRIEPGILAMCFGHSTGRWNKAYGALKHIYQQSEIWREVNRPLYRELDWSQLGTDLADYIKVTLGHD